MDDLSHMALWPMDRCAGRPTSKNRAHCNFGYIRESSGECTNNVPAHDQLK